MALEPIKTLPESERYYTRLSIGPYVRDGAFKLSKPGTNLVVHLPLPTELRDDTTVSYTNVNLETVGDAFLGRGANGNQGLFNAAMARNTGQLASAAMTGSNRGFGAALTDRGIFASATGALAGGLIGSVQSLLPPEQINSALQQKYGAAPNPNPSVQFQGPVLRDFALTWAFYPKNEAESRTIDSLIRKLKGRALPDENQGNSGAILDYPHICQLNFFPWDTDGVGDEGWNPLTSIIKIKKCFMSGVNVNYNAFGTPGFFEGTKLPISYSLTINFKEIEYLLSKDWDSTAATERAVTSPQFKAASFVDNTFALVLGTGADIVQGTISLTGDLLQGDYSTSNATEVQNEDNGREANEKLVDNNEESRTVWTVTPAFYSVDRLFAGAVPGEPYTYTSTRVNGKYQLVIQGPSRSTGDGGIRTPEPTIRTFDTEQQMREYLREQGVYRNGVQTVPPPPAAPAAAPRQ